jgi:hypothetical protein
MVPPPGMATAAEVGLTTDADDGPQYDSFIEVELNVFYSNFTR